VSRLAYPMLLAFLVALGAMLWVEHRGTSQLLAWLEMDNARAQAPRESDPAPAWPADRNASAAPWRAAKSAAGTNPTTPAPSAAPPVYSNAPATTPGRYVPPPQDPALDEAPEPQGYGAPRAGGQYGDAPLPKNVPVPADFAGTWLGFPLGSTLEVEAMPVKAGMVEVQAVNGRRVPVTRIRVSYRQPAQVTRTRPDGQQEQITIPMERALPSTPRMMLRGMVEDRGTATGGELVLVASEALPLGGAPIVASAVPVAPPLGAPPQKTTAGKPTAIPVMQPTRPAQAYPPVAEAPSPTSNYPSPAEATSAPLAPTAATPAASIDPATGYPVTAAPPVASRPNPYATPDRPNFAPDHPQTAEARPADTEPRPSYADYRARVPETDREPVGAAENVSSQASAPAPWARDRDRELASRPPASPAEVSIGDDSEPSEASISDVRPASFTPESQPEITRRPAPVRVPEPVAAPPAKVSSRALLAGDIEISETTILAMVNSEPILAGEVLSMTEPRLQEALAKVPPSQMENALKEVALARRALLQQAIEPLIQRKILYQDAKRSIPAANFPNVEEQLTKEFEKRVEQMMQKKGYVSRRQLEAEAAEQGNSLSQQKKAFIEELLAREFLTRNSSINEEVRREELLNYYRLHQEEYTQKCKVRWEQLMIKTSEFPSKEQARFAIGKLGNRILDGEDFATVAKTGSQGPTAKDGGKRDWTSQGSLVSKVLDEALFALPVGKLSSILEDDRGFHIVRVTERTEAGKTPFEDVQPDIRDKIKKERKEKAQQAYVEKLLKAAVVTRLLGDFKPPPMAQRP